MIQLFGQSASLDPLRPDESGPGSPGTTSGPFPSGNAGQGFLRAGLKRSLQLHRGLALGIVLTGAALAATYVLKVWLVYDAQSLVDIRPATSGEVLRAGLERTAGVEARLNGQLLQLAAAPGNAPPRIQQLSDLAADIARLQARFIVGDELAYDLLLEDSEPGSAFQIKAAVPPLHPASIRVVRDAGLIVFAGLAFALLGAVAATKRPTVPDELEQFPQRAAKAPQAQESTESMPNNEPAPSTSGPDIPWWLADIYSPPDPPQTAALPSHLSAHGPGAATVMLASPSMSESNPETATPQPQTSWVQSWVQGPRSREEIRPKVKAEEAIQPEREGTPGDAASRRDALRYPLSSVGLNDVGESAAPNDKNLQKFEDRTERSTFKQSSRSAPDHLPFPAAADISDEVDASQRERLVTAQREYHSSSLSVEKTSKESSSMSNANHRSNRREAYEEVVLLPTKRGQSRKKKRHL